MVYFSDDSSESENNFFNNRGKPSTIKKSGDLSKTHGIVVTNKKSPAKKSPIKQSVKSDNDSDGELNIPSKERGSYQAQNTSNDEQIFKRKIINIKKKPISSDDETEEAISKPPKTAQVERNLFNDEDQETLTKDHRQITNPHDSDETEDNQSQVLGRAPTTRRRIFIKQEIVSSEDEEPPNREATDKFISDSSLSQKENLSGSKSNEREGGGNFSDSEIPPSQFWLQQYKDKERKDDKKGLLRSTKKSSPIKKTDTIVDQKKTSSLKTEFIEKMELSQRKSPPRITKTEIVSTKFRKINQMIVKNKESSSDRDSPNNFEDKKKKSFIGLKESSDDNESEQLQGSKPSPDKLDDGDDILTKQLSPGKKRESPKKTPASSKRESSSKPKTTKKNSPAKEKTKVNKKSSPKKNLANESTKKPFETRPNICDNDTTSGEEKEQDCDTSTLTSPKYSLGLEKPKNSQSKTPKPNGTQMRLTLKMNNQISENKELNSPVKSPSPSRKFLIPSRKFSIDLYSSDNEDGENNVALDPKAEKKLSLKKKKQGIKRSDEKQTSSEEEAQNQKQPIAKHQESIEKVDASLKRKLDSDDSSSNGESETPRNVEKSPLRRKHSESNSPEMESNKCAKLTTVTKPPPDTMSDSDEEDPLTKLNTTLNKSMALMESQTKTIKSYKSRKSVSINTKQNLMYTPDDTRIQKNISQKSGQPPANDSNESSSDSQEQSLTYTPNDAKAQKSILKKSGQPATNHTGESSADSPEQNIPPVNATPKTIKRPLNLQSLRDQESLIPDLTKASFGLEDLSVNDEIYILDVPRTVDPKELKSQTLKLGGKNKFKIGGQSYETCNKDVANISCIFRTDGEQCCYKTVNLKPAGWISVRQKLSKSSHVELSPIGKKTVPFPEQLKIRHPLFGAEYEDKITIADKMVSRQISRPLTKDKSVAETIEVSRIEERPTRAKNVGKHKNRDVDRSEKLDKGEKHSKNETRKSLQLYGDKSESSDSDAEGSFFRKVKPETIVKHEKRKKSKSLSSILNIDKTPLTTNPPVDSEESIIPVKVKESLANKKLRLSLNSSALKNNSFSTNSKNGKFFSSTPIKIENVEEYSEDRVLPNKVRKRKTQDNTSKGEKSPKKGKTNWNISAFETKKRKVIT